MEKKGSSQIGIGIIVMSLVLLFGGIFLDPNNFNNSNVYNSDYSGDPSLNPNYLFYLSNVDLGKQQRVTSSYPNIILGSKEEFNNIYLGNDFRLNANPFTSIAYSFYIDITDLNSSDYFLLYFNLDRISGSQDLIVLADGKFVSKNQADSNNLPIRISSNYFNSSKGKITFLIEKPSWYSFFNWNKFDVNNLKIVESKTNKENKVRNFDFALNKKFLEKVYVDLVISCSDVVEVSEKIDIFVNGYILSSQNPNCISKRNTITVDIPLEILKNDGLNRLSLKSDGFYKVAYSLNKIYFNDQKTYQFSISNFNDFNDVRIYGDFDSEVIDMRINKIPFSLSRQESFSIKSLLKLGFNEIEILTSPVVFKELVIEKSTFNIN